MRLKIKYKTFFEHYFIISCIGSIILILFNNGYIESIIFPIIIYITAFYKKKKINLSNFYDFLILLLFFWMVCTWFINSYEYKWILILRCFMGQIAYMSAYYIGRNYSKSVVNNLFNNTLIPLAICCIIGIFWYFSPPNWYLNNTYKSVESLGGLNDLSIVLELSRLRSIFGSPYNIAYMCALCITFIFTKIYKEDDNSKKNYILIIIYLSAMLFCMMRAPIACSLIFFFISLIYFFKYKGNITTFIRLIVLLVIIIFIASIILYKLDPTIFEFINTKFLSVAEGPNDLISDRLNLYESRNYSYSLIGDGAGRHAFYVYDITPGKSIMDGEYTKIIVEQGYIGLSLYIILLTTLLIKCMYYFKYLLFELCIIIFYCITMLGANPLTTPDKYCFIFWLVAGYISSFKKQKG